MHRRVAILGAGDLWRAPAVMAALAAYHGERPLQIAIWDADPERAALAANMVARFSFVARGRPVATEYADPAEALEGARAAILFDERCEPSDFGPALAELPVLRLPAEGWPPPPPEEEREWWRFQVLRWANGEEYPMEWFEPEGSGVLRGFLDRFG